MEELLLKWWEKFPRLDSDAPNMSLRNQATYLLKKYKTQELEMEKIRYENDETIVTKEVRTLVRFKDVVCKYRPHLHMGDYWLDVRVIDEQVTYKFHSFIEPEEGKPQLIDAQHPHLSGGVPCLGSFQGDLNTNFKEGNFVQFFSVMKAYLQAYNGRSTYTRGTSFKKRKLNGYLHSFQEVADMFATEEDADTGRLDVYGIAMDPMRWNWPKEMTAFQHVIVEGQDPLHLRNYVSSTRYPILSTSRYNIFETSNESVLKVLGYVTVAMIIGELPLFQAFEFVRVFITTLQTQYEGDMDPETMKKLEKMAARVYEVKGNGHFKISDRYQTRVSGNSVKAAKEIWPKVQDYYVAPYGNSRERDKFHLHLKHLGHHLSNFIILLRKRAPHLAKASTYLTETKESLDIDFINDKYNIIKKEAYTMALSTMEKERRRFINELNKPEISNIVGTDGQGTLFS